MKWFAVGEVEAGCGWQAIRAENKFAAMQAFIDSEERFKDESYQAKINAIPVERWEGKDEITPFDWFDSGAGTAICCDECDTPTSAEPHHKGRIINGQFLCRDCFAEMKEASA